MEDRLELERIKKIKWIILKKRELNCMNLMNSN